MESVLNIITLITSLIALLTLFEMKKQRHALMLPNVSLNSKYTVFLKLDRRDLNDNYSIKGCPYRWSKTDEKIEPSDEITLPKYEIDLVNVGNGTATDIQYEWELDIEYYLNEIEKYKGNCDIEINYIFDQKRILYKTKYEGLCPRGLESDDYKISFLQSSQKITIDFSAEFILLFSTLLYVKLINKSKNEKSILYFANNSSQLPFPDLIIRYNDISGKKYKKCFQFKMDFCSLSVDDCSFFIQVIEK